MKNILGTTVALAVMAICISSAQAINISSASVQSGLAAVSGGKAAANSNISWEGGIVAKANKNGGFSFSGVVPVDCVGTLSDGVSTIDVALANCTPTPQSTAKVLKTGQTTCYDNSGNAIACPGTGQDGELQKGTARSYTVNVNGLTITDNATGLEWEKLCSGVGCPFINDVNTFYTWAQAFQKIADLNTANFAGHNDWRLPNINELQTLADYGQVAPAIDSVFNNGVDSFTQSLLYWSSTSFLGTPSGAWGVSFFFGGFGFGSGGGVFGSGKASSVSVRAVRGGS